MKKNLMFCITALAIMVLLSCKTETKRQEIKTDINKGEKEKSTKTDSSYQDSINQSSIYPDGKGRYMIVSEDYINLSNKDESTGIYRSVEIMPQFTGGKDAMLKYINKKMKYPSTTLQNKIEGRVILRFIVSKNGTLRDVTVLRSLDPACDKEAVRIIKSMPEWIPGKQNGEKVDVYFTLPIIFKLPS